MVIAGTPDEVAAALKPLAVDLAFYNYPIGRIELKENALDADGKFSPEALVLLKKLAASLRRCLYR